LNQNVLTQNYTVYGTSTGITYYFHVKSRNAFGYSVPSPTISVLSAQVPNSPMELQTNI